MQVDVSKIVSDKLAQMEADGIIQRKIEETLEKSVLDTISSELNSVSFRNSIAKQVQASVGAVASDCGFSAYNGFIAQTVKSMVQNLYTLDIAEKVQAALDDVLLKKHENIRLSDIFKRYRTWVLEHTDGEEKHERQQYTAELDVRDDGLFTIYTCRFADRPVNPIHGDRADIEVKIYAYGEREEDNISGLYLNGHNLRDTLKIGVMTEFEAFLANLYYNGTAVILDPDDVDTYAYFDIDD